MGTWEAFLYGFLGGLIPEVLYFYKERYNYDTSKLAHATSWFFWVCAVGMALIGGGLATLYVTSGAVLLPFLAINIGATAPLTLGTLVNERMPISDKA